jgi:RNA polymerase sigma-70 factor (ECF subfamily)
MNVRFVIVALIMIFPISVCSYFDQAGFEVTLPRQEGCLADGHAKAGDERWGELLAAAQNGDAEAYRLFLASITPFVSAVVRNSGMWAEQAEDVVQDVLLTVHRIRHTYEPGRPVKPWLSAIASRRAIDAMRRWGRVGAKEVHNDAAYETFADPQANKEEDGDFARQLARMSSELSPGQKEALELVKLREMSLAEASIHSGQSVALLKVNIHRAIKKMRLSVTKGRPG